MAGTAAARAPGASPAAAGNRPAPPSRAGALRPSGPPPAGCRRRYATRASSPSARTSPTRPWSSSGTASPRSRRRPRERSAATRAGGTALELSGEQLEPLLYGVAVAKTDTALRDAVLEALDRLIRNGEYAKILKKWHVEDGAVERAVVNEGP
ncbi:substrate-binding periplasmic protein [Streptomyces platensis]|uniref:substrate-binding periplasmic protein n=1 Tax=Streptomyces platensis TaxID=58346 RepID=UPI0039B749D9